MSFSSRQSLLNRVNALLAIDPKSVSALELCVRLQRCLGELRDHFCVLNQSEERVSKILKNAKSSVQTQDIAQSLLAVEIDYLRKENALLQGQLAEKEEALSKANNDLENLSNLLHECASNRRFLIDLCQDLDDSLKEKKEEKARLLESNRKLKEKIKGLAPRMLLDHIKWLEEELQKAKQISNQSALPTGESQNTALKAITIESPQEEGESKQSVPNSQEEQVSTEALKENKTLEERLRELRQQNSILEAQVKAGRDALGQTSQNSSIPPSKERFKGRGRSVGLGSSFGKKQQKRRPGKQSGAKGHGFHLPDGAEQRVNPCYPQKCLNCEKRNSCPAFLNSKTIGTRSTVDVEVKIVRTKHTLHSCVCPQDNSLLTGSYPEDVLSSFQYGKNIKALVSLLVSYGSMSVSRVYEVCKGFFGGVCPSIGTIQKIIEEVGDHPALTEGLNYIASQIKETSAPVHCDETTSRADKENLWVFTVTTLVFTFLGVAAGRSFKRMQELGWDELLKGHKIVHDMYRAYFLLEVALHGLCNAHLLRDLRAVLDFDKQFWGMQLALVLTKMNQMKKKLIEKGYTAFPPSALKRWRQQIAEILQLARLEILQQSIFRESEDLPQKRGRRKRSKAENLIIRFEQFCEEILAFATDFSIPFTNNLAEQSLRLFKVKLKVIGAFRTRKGLEGFARIYSFVSTGKKQGHSAYDCILAILERRPLDVVNPIHSITA